MTNWTKKWKESEKKMKDWKRKPNSLNLKNANTDINSLFTFLVDTMSQLRIWQKIEKVVNTSGIRKNPTSVQNLAPKLFFERGFYFKA